MTTKTDAGPNKHTHGLTATDEQIAALDSRIAALEAKPAPTIGDIDGLEAELTDVSGRIGNHESRITKLEGPVGPPLPPDPPGPLPTGVTPPKSVDRTGATDTTAALMTWLNGLPAGTLVDWDGGIYRLRQLLLEGKALRFTGAGRLVFTTLLTGSAAGAIHLRNQCHDMSFDHRGPDGKPQLRMVGAAPASDYGRAHTSQEAIENNHAFWLQGVQGVEIAGIEGYGFGGDSFYSGGWTAKAGQWTHDLHVHDCAFSAMGRMFGSLADGGTNVLVENNRFGLPIAGSPIDSLAKAGPGWNGVIIEPNDAPVADGSAYAYENVVVRGNVFGRGYHPGGVSGGATSASANGGTKSKLVAPIRWEDNTSDPAYPWLFVNSYGAIVTQAGNR